MDVNSLIILTFVIYTSLQIVALRKQIEILQNQISDTGGGGSSASGGSASGSGGATGSGRTSKTVSFCFLLF